MIHFISENNVRKYAVQAVDSLQSYEKKYKNDPIWQTYNRAYKAHYARYLKKKMTVANYTMTEHRSRSRS